MCTQQQQHKQQHKYHWSISEELDAAHGNGFGKRAAGRRSVSSETAERNALQQETNTSQMRKLRSGQYSLLEPSKRSKAEEGATDIKNVRSYWIELIRSTVQRSTRKVFWNTWLLWLICRCETKRSEASSISHTPNMAQRQMTHLNERNGLERPREQWHRANCIERRHRRHYDPAAFQCHGLQRLDGARAEENNSRRWSWMQSSNGCNKWDICVKLIGATHLD